MNWIQLTSEQAQAVYGVATEIANTAENTFFGVPIDLRQRYDDDRPFLAFLQKKEYPSVVTLHIKTIHPESWEHKGKLLNPLSVIIGGYLELDKEALTGLIAILSSYQEKLSFQPFEKRQEFMIIEDAKLADYRLHPEWFPNTRREHYIQVYDPLLDFGVNASTTILILGREIGFSTISLKIIQFLSQEFQDPHFEPLKQGHSKINLDRNGIQELITLLQKQMRYLG